MLTIPRGAGRKYSLLDVSLATRRMPRYRSHGRLPRRLSIIGSVLDRYIITYLLINLRLSLSNREGGDVEFWVTRGRGILDSLSSLRINLVAGKNKT